MEMDAGHVLYVGGIDQRAGEETLHSLFVPFGDVVRVVLPEAPGGRAHRGHAFVEFAELVRRRPRPAAVPPARTAR